jgi:Tfp pilus assembly protein PilF
MQTPEVFSLKKKLLLIFILIVVAPCVIIAIIETGLRLFSKASTTDFFVAGKIEPERKVFRANYSAAKRFFPGNLARKPLPEIFSATKDKNTFRVFVLGESAARGESLADFSFSVMIKTVLQTANPQKKIEVVNTGIPAINSWVINEISKEITDFAPDLVIIYAGHNEFIGPYGPASAFSGNLGRMAIKTGIFASSLRLIQLLKSDKLPENLEKGWQGLEMFLDNLIKPDDPSIQIAHKNWELNLNEIVSRLCNNKTQVIACTLPSNLVDCAPFHSSTSSENHKEILQQLTELYRQGDFGKIVKNSKDFAPLLDSNAISNWFLAKSYIKIGLKQQNSEMLKLARKHFYKARDLDCFRVRASSTQNQAIRKCATKYPVKLIDLEKVFDDISLGGTTGKDLIYDHVHLSEKGHIIVANTILNKLAETNLFPDIKIDTSLNDKIVELIGITNFDRRFNLQRIIAAMSQKPFTIQFNHNKQIENLKTELTRLEQQIDLAGEIYQATDAVKKFRKDHKILNRLALMYTETGQIENALVYYKLALEKNPFDIYTLNNVGSLLITADRFSSARQFLNRALLLEPDYSDAWFNLGLAATKENNIKEAVKNYKKALQIDPGAANAARNLANLYFRNKNFKNAEKYYKVAALIAPDDINSLIGTGNALEKQNLFDSARKIYATVIASYSKNPIGYYSMGLAFEKEKHLNQAEEYYEKAVKLNFAPAARRLFGIYDSLASSSFTQIELARIINKSTKYKDPYDLQLLGVSYARNNQIKEAAQTLNMALEFAKQKNLQALVSDIETALIQIHDANLKTQH